LWDAVNRFTGGRGLVIIYVSGLIVIAALFWYLIIIKKERSPFRYLLFFIFLYIFFKINRLSITPAEKIHLFMYSGLSAILYNALKIDLDRYSLRLYVCGMVICLAVGFFDEVIQFFLPNRVFDWRDVIINFASSVTAFMVIRFNILRSS
jgi:hypothetical protein